MSAAPPGVEGAIIRMGRVGHSAAGAADAIETANRARADRRIVISRTSIGRQAPLYSMAPPLPLDDPPPGRKPMAISSESWPGLSPRLPHPTLPRVPGRVGGGEKGVDTSDNPRIKSGDGHDDGREGGNH